MSMFLSTAAVIRAAIKDALGEQLDIDRARLDRDVHLSRHKRKGARNRSILSARVEDGVLHTFHATKGPRRRRIFAAAPAAA